MKVLVLGGTGAVGSNVVRELMSRGADVRVLTRDPAKAKGLPAGARAVRGDQTAARHGREPRFGEAEDAVSRSLRSAAITLLRPRSTAARVARKRASSCAGRTLRDS